MGVYWINVYWIFLDRYWFIDDKIAQFDNLAVDNICDTMHINYTNSVVTQPNGNIDFTTGNNSYGLILMLCY